MSTYRSVSVLTLVRGRQQHLDHLVAGLDAQRFPPDELVVAYMQDDAPNIETKGAFPVRYVRVEGEPMPLAAARNRAANMADGNVLAFLDVDCIPDPDFVRRAAEGHAFDPQGVFLPEVRYLPGNSEGWRKNNGAPDYNLLAERGVRHPSKRPLNDTSFVAIADFGELWGLAFIMGASVWRSAGGMDEDYVGYGAEETDLGQRLRLSGANMYWIGGTVCFHQHHYVHRPPMQHFDAIVRNARLYHSRWGKWCMGYWLDDFERRGLVTRTADRLEIMRSPTTAEIAASRQGDDVLFS
ncbi:glycosyltransferase [Qipengyuania sp. GH1]|uniref:glycosyltransferase family 2 protein n=1 Tax=Qipengyuania aestuarii TaxID=2867241 RepID=UPI001C88D20E|nr:glycosyltransferase [Qipengyuania aestuarii]